MGLLIRPVRHKLSIERPEPLLAITPPSVGWQYISFSAYELRTGQTIAGTAQGQETVLLLLAGRGEIQLNGQQLGPLGNRASVFEDAPPAALYLAGDSSYQVTCLSSRLEIVLASVPANRCHLPARVLRPETMSLEMRGAGNTERYIRHILDTDQEAERIIVVEVITPNGHWSSFPPHKHDTESPPLEAYLEEVYYYHFQPAEGFALQRVYYPGDLDETVAVHDGDLVLVPRGYHTVAAVPGYDLYYLNIMAGPRRSWQYQVDPIFRHLLPPSGSITGKIIQPVSPVNGA
ncbi:5-deoxy-glucuronate isomerase [Thermogemmatispora tikiterensis]|uniref:5-deoxy-glucuronate isomerase n=1 Tax=Thermogemmatispora tikiterensis TaxID=1825093 RepID=A0A328VG95_9CHLR|nr:5-deoxy-glucuronate isomerase [Thermogemmatispora tikiterensis]RAQ95861.1 5-deoxy-glucuronate isomerase [Thermogemmatispora tikiterensis]